MKLSEKVLKPISETSYLTAENARRYRAILRFFYLENEKINYWITQEEVFAELSSHGAFADYTMEQCRQDLNMLVEWNNLMPLQDMKKAGSIEAFKNKQFRYQITEYTVVIERMTVQLENLSVEGASLEPTLLERLCAELGRFAEMVDESPVNVYGWWDNLNHDFIRLNTNYQDYMRQMNSARAEELMKSREFLVYKDKLIDYLRSFVRGLQVRAGIAEKLLRGVTEEQRKSVFQKVLAYEMSIPRIDGPVSEADIYDKISGRWTSLCHWFVSPNGGASEAERLFDMTNETIRKITRYAAQISERISGGANRKEEYRQLCRVFAGCGSVKEAHCLSAMVFGVEKPIHFKGEFSRQTDSIQSGVYEEPPECFQLAPRVRVFKESFDRGFIREHQEEKEQLKRKAMEQIRRERRLVDGYIRMNVLEFGELPEIEPEVRAVLLRWLSKGLERKDGRARTEDGREYRIVNRDEKRECLLRCSDGVFRMPAYTIEFEEQDERI